MTLRSSVVAIAAAFCLAGAGPAAQQSSSSQSVDDIVAKNIEAKGGLAKMKSVLTLKQTSQMTVQGMEGSLTVYNKRPNMVRQEMTLAGRVITNGFDGQVAWIINPMAGSSRPVVLAGPQLEQIREQSGFDGPLVDYRGQGSAATLEGTETLGDRKVLHLRLTSLAGQVTHFYLDAATYLDVKQTNESEQMKLEQEFGDFRDVDGIKAPFLIRQIINGVVQSEIKVQKIELNLPLDDALFRLPKGSE